MAADRLANHAAVLPGGRPAAPLALTNLQLAAVRTAAAMVPASWRTRFWSAIADCLMARAAATDADVHDAIRSVLARFGCAPINGG